MRIGRGGSNLAAETGTGNRAEDAARTEIGAEGAEHIAAGGLAGLLSNFDFADTHLAEILQIAVGNIAPFAGLAEEFELFRGIQHLHVFDLVEDVHDFCIRKQFAQTRTTVAVESSVSIAIDTEGGIAEAEIDQLVAEDVQRWRLARVLRVTEDLIDQAGFLAVLHFEAGEEEERLVRGQDVGDRALGGDESEPAEVGDIVRAEEHERVDTLGCGLLEDRLAAGDVFVIGKGELGHGNPVTGIGLQLPDSPGDARDCTGA